ncbi:hypothetical protein PENCOP_c011G02558 [Penicillium coprophilum]|uniref:NACHT domain-containing protein n=1 Tax=Penicillium coprophilum TaxID=36646 RepID=A0A1V6UE30_9EURO|nr:hypothetical protein PENCOP_c011G02558 [Penicillium coprophilum]
MTSTTYTGPNHGLQIGNNHGPVTAEFHQSYTTEDIDRFCLQDLCCPDSLVVKNRLKETKDKLLPQSFQWIFQDPQYQSWRNGADICLLWIKGGAGTGKTMMSIGLIEELSRARYESTVVTYSFCQNADSELNTLESIIKGLILQLINQQIDLRESLRRRWNTKNDRFNEDVTSWRTLWNILFEMLDRCDSSKIYMIVDALDECQDSGMADFLKLIVRNGLDYPAKIKWLLTSRPLDSAERALLAGHDQVQVSLDLNSKCVSQAVKAYISHKVAELSYRQRYGETLRREVETELSAKAEGTFLWVSLVCKRLESVRHDKALTIIQHLPPGLHPFYDRILNELSEGEPDDVHKCMRLLKAMMLAYRPLKVEEVPSLTGLTNEDNATKGLVNRCASFLRMQENNIEFVHQSARDYLAEKNGQSILNSYERFGHYEIVLGCLSHLSEWLQVNLIHLPRPDSTKESRKPLEDEKRRVELSCLDYAAIFWVQHLENIKRDTISYSGLFEKGAEDPLVLALVQDATRFLLRHYHTLTNWPLQIYSSAVIFSPESSVVRRKNMYKIPGWLRRIPPMENHWTFLIQTLARHSRQVRAMAFSPDGKHIVSGSDDKTIKLWDAMTGDLQKTLEGHSHQVTAVAFSPDGKYIVSGSDDETIKLWDTTTGVLQKTLVGHSHQVKAVAFSPDNKHIISSSDDQTIKLWDTITGDLQKTLEGHSHQVRAIAFSPDSKYIASGSDDKTIKLWDTITGDLQKTLEGHSHQVRAIAFSPDSKYIASGSNDKTIKLWDTMTGNLYNTLAGNSGWVNAVTFSPDGKHMASGSGDGAIKLWDATPAEHQMTLAGHSGRVIAVAFSLDGKHIASGSDDETIKLWDSITGDLQKTLVGHSGRVMAVAFSLDSKQIASCSGDGTIKLWDTTIGNLCKTLIGHSGWVIAIAFSPNGNYIASSSSDKTIKLWDTTTGNLQKTLVGHSGWVIAVAFSPDGKSIASGSDDETIKLWDTTTGNLQKTLVGHSGRVMALAFSLDGKHIASGSGDKTIKLWDAHRSVKASKYLGRTFSSRLKFRSWQEIRTSEPIFTLKFSPDNRYLATNLGPIRLDNNFAGTQNTSLKSLQDIYVKNQWICYGGMHFLRLPSDFVAQCCDVQGDQVTIGCQNGRVLRFEIDRSSLQSFLRGRSGHC